MKLATSSQMQALDLATIQTTGIPGIVLMENAGKGTVTHMVLEFGSLRGKSVIIFAGPGNNGGDGLVIARHVLQQGGFPFIIFLLLPDKLRGEAAVNAEICSNLHIPSAVCLVEDDIFKLKEKISRLHFSHPVHCLVDALFGTGLRRNLEGRFSAIVELINHLSQQQSWPVTAVDIPSGLCADTGQSLGCSVQADLTVTYGLAKPGHYHHGGAAVGKLAVIDIGIPEQIVEQANLPGIVLNHELRNQSILRQKNSHKGQFGHLLLLAGSEGKTGAALLSGQAALHSGCGLVTLAVPSLLNPIFETTLPEAMTVPLPVSEHYLVDSDYEFIINLLNNKAGLVIGPGLGTRPETENLVKKLYNEVPQTVVVDADALNLLANDPETLLEPGGPRILTPHPGEMARLMGTRTATIQKDRLGAASWLAAENIKSHHEIITVLKGAGTVVYSSNGRWAINSNGNHGMATGGMGDVLAGLIGGLLAQGYAPVDAANIGVYLHGLAADNVAADVPCGYLASDVAKALPAARKCLFSQMKSS